MLNTKVTKFFLIAIGTTGILSAFPEPFEMESRLSEMAREMLERAQREGSQDYGDHACSYQECERSDSDCR